MIPLFQILSRTARFPEKLAATNVLTLHISDIMSEIFTKDVLRNKIPLLLNNLQQA